jgi:hypothetical protein
MINITLVIPAKNESESLPLVMENLKNIPVKKIVILEKNGNFILIKLFIGCLVCILRFF